MRFIERIKHNSKYWELNEGKELGINLKFDCVKSFMDTDTFREFSTKYGLDFEIVASFWVTFTQVGECWGKNVACNRGLGMYTLQDKKLRVKFMCRFIEQGSNPPRGVSCNNHPLIRQRSRDSCFKTRFFENEGLLIYGKRCFFKNQSTYMWSRASLLHCTCTPIQ